MDDAAALIVRHVRDLPAMPAVVAEVIASLSSEDVDAFALADRIALDQALTAKVLRLANSSFYGLPSRVTSVRQALSILGLRSVRTVVTACAITGRFTRSSGGLDFDAFWRHSVAAALGARLLALECGANQELAFTAALLHDVGKLVMATALPEKNEQMLAYRREHECDGVEAERAVFGIDHAAIGRELAASWRFPEIIVDSVGQHHDVDAPSTPLVTTIVHVASTVAHALDLAGVEDEMVSALSSPGWRRLALSEAQTDGLFAQVEATFADTCEILLN